MFNCLLFHPHISLTRIVVVMSRSQVVPTRTMLTTSYRSTSVSVRSVIMLRRSERPRHRYDYVCFTLTQNHTISAVTGVSSHDDVTGLSQSDVSQPCRRKWRRLAVSPRSESKIHCKKLETKGTSVKKDEHWTIWLAKLELAAAGELGWHDLNSDKCNIRRESKYCLSRGH